MFNSNYRSFHIPCWHNISVKYIESKVQIEMRVQYRGNLRRKMWCLYGTGIEFTTLELYERGFLRIGHAGTDAYSFVNMYYTCKVFPETTKNNKLLKLVINGWNPINLNIQRGSPFANDARISINTDFLFYKCFLCAAINLVNCL